MMRHRFFSALALSSILIVGAPACATAQDEIVRTNRVEPVNEARAEVALNPASYSPAAFDQISNTLDDAAAAWSTSDIDSIMGFYDLEQPLLVMLGDAPLKGPEPVRAHLGALAARDGGLGVMNYEWFETLQIDPFTAIVSGRIIITRNGQHHRGLFTRVLRQTQDGWKILHDQIALPPEA